MEIKRYILFVYDSYYPNGGWHDYKDSFDTIDETKKSIQITITGRNGFDDLVAGFVYVGTKYNNYNLIDLETGEAIDLFDKPLKTYIE